MPLWRFVSGQDFVLDRKQQGNGEMGLRHRALLMCVAGLAFPAAASAQSRNISLVSPVGLEARAAPISNLPNFQLPAGDLREVGVTRKSGLIAAFPIRRGLQIGVGRFNVSEIARPRTHVETDRQPMAVQSRDRGIAAVGVNVRF